MSATPPAATPSEDALICSLLRLHLSTPPSAASAPRFSSEQVLAARLCARALQLTLSLSAPGDAAAAARLTTAVENAWAACATGQARIQDFAAAVVHALTHAGATPAQVEDCFAHAQQHLSNEDTP